MSIKKPGMLVTMDVALFFAEHRSATNSLITISSTLLSLNLLTLDYIGVLVSVFVSSIHITWMLESALFISQFCSSSSSRVTISGKAKIGTLDGEFKFMAYSIYFSLKAGR